MKLLVVCRLYNQQVIPFISEQVNSIQELGVDVEWVYVRRGGLLGYFHLWKDIRAAIGIAQLHKIQQDLAQRQKVREQYLKQLSDISEIYVPFKDNQYFSSNYILPIVLKQSTQQYRNEIRNRIHACGVQTSNHYPAVHRFSAFCSAVSLPLTEYVSDNELILPMYAALTDTQITYVVDVLKSAINQ